MLELKEGDGQRESGMIYRYTLVLSKHLSTHYFVVIYSKTKLQLFLYKTLN